MSTRAQMLFAEHLKGLGEEGGAAKTAMDSSIFDMFAQTRKVSQDPPGFSLNKLPSRGVSNLFGNMSMQMFPSRTPSIGLDFSLSKLMQRQDESQNYYQKNFELSKGPSLEDAGLSRKSKQQSNNSGNDKFLQLASRRSSEFRLPNLRSFRKAEVAVDQYASDECIQLMTQLNSAIAARASTVSMDSKPQVKETKVKVEANRQTNYYSNKLKIQAVKKRKSKQEVIRIETKNNKTKSVQRGQVHCLCKRTRCSRLYCLCFKNGLACSELCNCTDCGNKGDAKAKLNRDFLKKVLNKHHTPSSQKKDCCNCRKNFCKTKYCKCRALGKSCGDTCTCMSCQNKEDLPAKNQSHELKTSHLKS